MRVNSIHINQINIDNMVCVKKKRERAVYTDEDHYYKIWVPNWTQGDITKAALDLGFYDESISNSLISLVFDESGQRGYICKKGTELWDCDVKDWDCFINLTTEDQRFEFISKTLENSLKCSGIFSDFFPGNLVLCDNKISFIDFDSFRSFNFIFNGEREWYEKFDLDAWWNPLSTARRDLNISLNSYFSECLNLNIDDNIVSQKDLELLLRLVL